MKKLLLGIALVATSFSFSANAEIAKPKKKYPKHLFSVSVLHYDATRQPLGLDWYARTDAGKIILGGIAASLGYPTLYIEFAKAAVPTATTAGQETNYTVPLAKGYAPCAARVTVTSIVRADGPRASTVNAAINPNEVQVSTWTDTPAPGGGRTWAEGDVAYYGIKPKYLKEFIKKGVCKEVTTQVGFLSCRGRAACSAGGTYGNPEAAAKTTVAKK